MKKLLLILILLPMSLCVACTADNSKEDSIDKEEATISVEDTINQSSDSNEIKEEVDKTEDVAKENKGINSTEVTSEEVNNDYTGEPYEEEVTEVVNDTEMVEEQEILITYNTVINQNEQYELPTEVEIMINNQAISVPVDWQGIKVDTSYAGAFTYEGINEEYDVKVDVILTINKIESKSEIGIIKNVVELEGKTYIEMDVIEFYRGEEALNEAIKDGNAQYDEELGKYYLPDGYYIRNTDEEITTYELAENVEYYLCAYDVGNVMENSATNVSVSKEQFIEYINKSSEYDYMSCNRAKLFWVDTINNRVKSLAKQYTP